VVLKIKMNKDNASTLDVRHDPMGAAIADFYKNGVAAKTIVAARKARGVSKGENSAV